MNQPTTEAPHVFPWRALDIAMEPIHEASGLPGNLARPGHLLKFARIQGLFQAEVRKIAPKDLIAAELLKCQMRCISGAVEIAEI
eukprot:8838937-Pyramimonas_sp.AAC.1